MGGFTFREYCSSEGNAYWKFANAMIYRPDNEVLLKVMLKHPSCLCRTLESELVNAVCEDASKCVRVLLDAGAKHASELLSIAIGEGSVNVARVLFEGVVTESSDAESDELPMSMNRAGSPEMMHRTILLYVKQRRD